MKVGAAAGAADASVLLSRGFDEVFSEAAAPVAAVFVSLAGSDFGRTELPALGAGLRADEAGLSLAPAVSEPRVSAL